MEEAGAMTKAEVTMVREKAKSLGLRVNKIHRRISWEEFNERWFKGLCMFCGEFETPDHHLRHKNSRILMMDYDENQVPSDEELVDNEVATELNESEDRAVQNEAKAEVISTIVKEESIPQIQMVTEVDSIVESNCVQHMNLILQHQVSLSPLELSLNFCKANLNVMGNCHYTMGRTHQIQSHSGFGCVNDNACHVFGVIPLRRTILPKERKKRFHKSWRFKFKHRVKPSYFTSGFEAKRGKNAYEVVLHKKRQRKTPKCPKSWKFRFKNMNLQRIMTQLDTQQFVYRWDSECNPHLSIIVHNVKATHRQSSFVFVGDFQVMELKFVDLHSTSLVFLYGAAPLQQQQGDVGMDKIQSHLSLRTNQIWDPGGLLFEDVTPW